MRLILIVRPGELHDLRGLGFVCITWPLVHAAAGVLYDLFLASGDQHEAVFHFVYRLWFEWMWSARGRSSVSYDVRQYPA